MGTGLGVKLLAMVGSLVLTRFIAPDEYGEVSVASICVLTATMLSTLGTGQWLIARKATPGEAWHALIIHLGLGAVAYGVLMLIASNLGPLLDAPHMDRFVPGFVLAGFLEKVQYIPEKILARGLHFRTIALSRGAGDIVYTATALALAPVYFGWGMVWGNITRALVVASLMIWASNRKEWLAPTRLSLETTKTYFTYGLPFGVGLFAEFVSSRWDNLLVSHYFGTEATGHYAMAYNLAETPTGAIADQIGAVLMPSFAQLEPEQRVAALVRSGSLMALIMFPLAVGLGAVAHTLFAVVFDPRWQAGASMLVILSVLSIVKPMTWTLVGYSHAQQQRRLIMLMGLFKAIVLVVTVVLLAQVGLHAMCVGVGVAFAIYGLVFLRASTAPDPRVFWAYLGGALPVLLSCVPMVAAVLGVRFAAAQLGYRASVGLLIVEIVAGGLAYVGAALVIARKVSFDFLNLLRNAMRRRAA